jgi:phosphatidylglycerol:prolipoprotein diacylglycerol transferase
MVLLAVLQWLYLNPKVRERQGAVAGAFLLGYAAMRIFVELFREPDGQIGFLAAGTTLGQWLSVPLVLLGGVLLVRARRAAP